METQGKVRRNIIYTLGLSKGRLLTAQFGRFIKQTRKEGTAVQYIKIQATVY